MFKTKFKKNLYGQISVILGAFKVIFALKINCIFVLRMMKMKIKRAKNTVNFIDSWAKTMKIYVSRETKIQKIIKNNVSRETILCRSLNINVSRETIVDKLQIKYI